MEQQKERWRKTGRGIREKEEGCEGVSESAGCLASAHLVKVVTEKHETHAHVFFLL